MAFNALAPHYKVGVRCYDNGGKTADRYTVVFTGRYRNRTGGVFCNRGMSARPCHPQGYGFWGESDTQIDYPAYSHLGKRVNFYRLPEECRKLIMEDIFDLSY
jgi:hypothetical protein